ncbi:2-keto-4-pentenoate hydratase [Oceanisphaera litoralis]|uniref:2-keto-4-pentenoate hydratase n=1 Tax=Oceanisphaera litoralis TaxID=225144 RepID=UPI00195E0B2C|nr:fumarylacetoacetate hydrolase family protein [Oceanisphaera litoralis]MBM7456761.1 2-keto-4-pentenoate hydratase [Oceanisphaera litoralis]
MTLSHLEYLAERLVDAERKRQPCAPLREDIRLHQGDAIEAAYRIQQSNVQRRLDAGARIVGRKIGLTSVAVQRQLGVDSPDYGCLFADMACGDNEEIPLSRLLQPKVEAEIVLVLERDLSCERHTVADLIGATAYALPALEIVDSRIADWNIGLTDTIADNASCGLFVLGSRPVSLSRFDLVDCTMRLTENGTEVSRGQGSACLGNPLNAACWLADRMVQLGTPLQAGDILLTGALGPMQAVRAGATYHADIEGLGRVRTRFSTLES